MREPSSDDLDGLVDLAVVGEREENVDDVLAIIGMQFRASTYSIARRSI